MTLAIDRRAALWGDRVAVVDYHNDEEVTYNDLASRATATAARLNALGIGDGDVVAVLSRNRVDVLELLFAAHQLGAILAPISHRLTPSTVEAPLERIDADLVLYESAQRDLVRPISRNQKHQFDELADIDGDPATPVTPDPDTPLLYLAAEYTPDEGDIAVILNRQVEWNCITTTAAWGLGRTDIAPVLLPLSLADGLLRLVLPLLYVGGTVVLQRAFDPIDTIDAIDATGATCAFGNTKELQEIVDRDAFDQADLSQLEWVACGDRAPTDVQNAYRKRNIAFSRMYGRAEAGPNLLYVPFDQETSDPECVGQPFPDATVRIVNNDKTPTDTGEPGRLQVSGPLVARGYLDQPDFDEWVDIGDEARRDEDGNYYVRQPDVDDRDDAATGGW